MQTDLARFLGNATTLVVLLSACPVKGQSYLIDDSTRNGSFEDAVVSPWGGIDTVSMDADFASSGEWFGEVQSTLRTSSWQYLSVDPAHGREFVVRFDARIGTPGFDTVSAYINAWNADGTHVSPEVTVVSAVALGTDAWAYQERHFVFPATMDGTTIRLGLDISGGDGVSTSVGYFDNVVLLQVPEPSAHALILVALGVMLCWRHNPYEGCQARVRRRTRSLSFP